MSVLFCFASKPALELLAVADFNAAALDGVVPDS
jgi:hypothetical protein